VPSGLPILDVGASRPLDALFEAVRLRSAGERFVVRVDVNHPRPAFALRYAERIIETIEDRDERLAAFDALAREQLTVNGITQRQASVLDRRIVQTIREIVMLSDGLAVTSSYEHFRIELTFGVSVEPYYVEALPDRPVPQCVAATVPDAIVVWAPTTAPADLTLVAFALEELNHPVYVVCAEGKRPALRAQFVAYEDAAAVLSRARLAIDPSLNPANAVALSALNVPLVVSLSSGAVEFLDGARLFAPWDRTDVLRAVQDGLGAPPPSRRHRPAQPRSSGILREPESLDGPLVSIVVRTRDRPEFLERALQSLERQTYRNLEIVVVNDAGKDVSGIVARFARTRSIVHETNRGAVPSANAGLRASQGEFVGLLDDDDVLFPDHVSTLVAALERSGADVAHADAVSAFYDVSTGSEMPYGYAIFLNRIGEPTDLFITDGIGPMSALYRRAVALELGGYDEALPHSEDWDLWLRLSQRYDFVHVPRVTAQYSIRNDGTNMMSYNAEGFKRSLYQLAEKFPLAARPMLEQARVEMIRRSAPRASQAIFPQPGLERR
jgi:hypothetical protein